MEVQSSGEEVGIDRYGYKKVNTKCKGKDQGTLAWTHIMALPLTLGELLHFSVRQSPHL